MIIDDAFATWAFGSAWEKYKSLDADILDMIQAWNELHQDMIMTGYHIFEDLMTMRQVYDDLHREDFVDKKMHKVTKQMQVAEKAIKQGKSKQAVSTLKKAEKKNENLVKLDKEVRDPMLKKCKKEMS